jgi:hypothetical protein
MGSTVFVHVGLPKTGTTYLQRVLARNRRTLARQGVLYPGRRVDHFLAVQDLLGKPFRGHADPRIEGSWKAVVAASQRAPGTVVLSHELLSTARAEVIHRLVEDLSPLSVEVVATVRDFPRQLLAVWQEDVKNGSTEPFPDYLDRVVRTAGLANRLRRQFWRYQDAPGILDLWARELGPSRVTLVTVPPVGTGSEHLWSRFADAVGISAVDVDLEVPQRNVSLGAAETEVLRLVNTWAMPELAWPDYRRLVKKHLAEEALAARTTSTRLALPGDVEDWALEHGRSMAQVLGAAGYRVVGSLDDLQPPRSSLPDELTEWPPPTDTLLEAALAAVRELLTAAAWPEEQP